MNFRFIQNQQIHIFQFAIHIQLISWYWQNFIFIRIRGEKLKSSKLVAKSKSSKIQIQVSRSVTSWRDHSYPETSALKDPQFCLVTFVKGCELDRGIRAKEIKICSWPAYAYRIHSQNLLRFRPLIIGVWVTLFLFSLFWFWFTFFCSKIIERTENIEVSIF